MAEITKSSFRTMNNLLDLSYGKELTPSESGLRIFALAFLFFALVMNIQTHGWVAWYRMNQSGLATHAEVISLQPENHGGCTIRYTVDSKVFEIFAEGCKAAVGQSIEIRYLPSDPLFVTLESPLVQLALQIGGAFFLSVVVGIQVALRKKKSRKKP